MSLMSKVEKVLIRWGPYWHYTHNRAKAKLLNRQTLKYSGLEESLFPCHLTVPRFRLVTQAPFTSVLCWPPRHCLPPGVNVGGENVHIPDHKRGASPTPGQAHPPGHEGPRGCTITSAHIPALGPKATPATEEMELLSLAEPKGKSDPVEDGESMFWWPTSSLCHNNHHSCICTPLYRQRVHSQPLLPLSQQ